MEAAAGREVEADAGLRGKSVSGEERFHAKRKAGVPVTRKDGSTYSAACDKESAAAEFFGVRCLGGEPNTEVHGEKGDPGYDMVRQVRIDVKWLGAFEDGSPRAEGHLIVNPEERDVYPDIYVVVRGSEALGFRCIGWLSHQRLVRRHKKDFGFGEKWCCPVSELRPMVQLYSLLSLDGG